MSHPPESIREPCSCCGTAGGAPHSARGSVPGRYDGTPYGFGPLCVRCRRRFYQRRWRAGVRSRYEPPPHEGWEPTPEEIAAAREAIRGRGPTRGLG